jgi:oligopeptide transport system substrate-binding protein
MKKKIIYSVILTLIIASCGVKTNKDNPLFSLRKGKGERYYGGVFRLNESEYVKNLFPLSITDAYSYRVASQVYEGLFKFDDETLKVKPCLADSFSIDSTRTIYTIYIKHGVYFQDDPCFPGGKGRELTASDLEYCFTRLCVSDVNNQAFSSIFKGILSGADNYYNLSLKGKTEGKKCEGIRILNKYTIQLILNRPNSVFLVNLAKPGCFIYPKEAFEKYGLDMRIKAVGTGPFKIQNVDEDVSIILAKNSNYHGTDEFGNQLPFLDAISIQFIKDKKAELFEFRKGNLEMVYRLPTEYILEILEEASKNNAERQFELQRVPEMMTQFLTFNLQDPIFSNSDVRKAFSYSIDREKILDFVLNGEGYEPGLHGITPPVFNDYDISDIKGYNFNVDSAKYYLAKAGYPDGLKFPKIELLLNPEGERNTNVAVEIQKQLNDNLNIKIDLVILPFAQLVERSYQGNFRLIRSGWVADFPNAENFLWIFNGADVPNNKSGISYPNIARYKNEKFDSYYKAALISRNSAEANISFKMAENELMNDAPIIILWYDEGYRLVKSYINNFPNNPMQYRDFSEVYFSEQKSIKK